MSLSAEIVAARIACHIAAMKVMAAQVGVRRAEGECLPLPAPAPSVRRSRPPPLLGSGGDGHPKL
jgi:hypothetical protein